MRFILLNFNWRIIFILVVYLVKSDSKLTQLHIIFRHGERAPTDTFPTDPYINYSWPGGWGQLTNNGKLQIYQLGQRIRNEYSHFIPTTYRSQDVNITSSYSDRCLMSGEVFCAGLYPPEGDQIWNKELLWQPIPINYLPRTQDTNIVMKAPCAKYDKIFKDIRTTPPIMEIENKYKELKDYLSEHTGLDVKNIEDVESISNTLQIEKLHNFSLPNWMNESMLGVMKQLAIRNLALYSETTYMKRVKGGVFLKNMVESMESILNGNQKPKLYLYSAHDLTLVHILRALDLVDTIGPDFGASLIFELYSDGEVKITYRDVWHAQPTILSLKYCTAPCYIADFKKAYDYVLPLDYNKDCENRMT